MRHPAPSLTLRQLLPGACWQTLVKLAPSALARQPVMLVTAICALLATLITLGGQLPAGLSLTGAIQLCLWLWLTVLFANFSEALAEGRGKARADSLRQGLSQLTARLIDADGRERSVAAASLRPGDEVWVNAGELIPADGEVVAGCAAVNEAAITGESAPVIREAGGDRSGVTGNTLVVSDRIRVRVTVLPGHSTMDRMIALVEGAKRQKAPNEIALDAVLIGLTFIFVLVVLTLPTFAAIIGGQLPLLYLAALVVTLIPTTIGGLISAIGIAGMDRLVRRNVIAKSGKAVEAAGDAQTLLLDKTGTITFGNRLAAALLPAAGVAPAELARYARLASLADATPEGKSVVALVDRQFPGEPPLAADALVIPFSADTRLSGVDVGATQIRKGAVDAMLALTGQPLPTALKRQVEEIATTGGTPLLVAVDGRLLGAIHLKDVVKPGIRERFAELRALGIRTIMVTGDNPLTAAAIAAEAGVDDYLAEATPERKLAYIREQQQGGRLVAMCGDGANDAPALAQADVGLAMNDGTAAAREAANMVDLDSDPTKLLDVVTVGKQLLVTRGALTTFSIANDVAKYFAILPALFVTALPPLAALNVMGLHSPASAVLAATIFNALIILALVPLALRGVKLVSANGHALLRRNLLVYGLGGLIAPFIGIKLIDTALVALNWI